MCEKLQHCADPHASPIFPVLPGHIELHASLCRSATHRPARMLTAASWARYAVRALDQAVPHVGHPTQHDRLSSRAF